MWNTDWNAALPSLITTLLPSACRPDYPRPLADPLPEADHARRFRRGVGEVDGVALGDDQGVAAGERADVEEGEVVVVFVDPDGGGITGDDGTEHAGHPPR